jgi:hypothetical protein
MSERVKKFSLKRSSRVDINSFIAGKIYPVYRNDTDRYRNLAFYIVDEYGSKQFFNTINGQLETYRGHLRAEYWEVIRAPKEENTMKKQFKAGDKIRFKNSWCDVTAGKEYELIQEGNSLKFIDDVGDELNFYDLLYQCRTGIASDKKLMEDEQTPDPAADVKPVFVEATITELIEAISNGEQSQYYIYNQKKASMVSVALEMTLHQLFKHQILRKVIN